jgi:two-component system, NtrC family, response regulator AtoC
MKPPLSWERSPAMRAVAGIVERVADCDAPVLVTGESGVGKEVIARELHRRSSRSGRPFVKVNCAAVPADLLESEMFGHEKGAFTGAEVATAGKFEAAADGTIMLDEIAEIPALLQAKLLHVLDDGRYSKLGGNRQLTADARVIAATNRELPERISQRLFREDLYYRLQVIEIYVPPLRERREEIGYLAESFLEQFSSRTTRPALKLSRSTIAVLESYDWPGNVRELENVIQRLAILQDEAHVLAELKASEANRESAALAAAAVMADAEPQPLDTEPESLPDQVRKATEAVEREVIERVLGLVHWNRRRAAEQLGVSYKTLLNKTKALGIEAGSSSAVPDGDA